MTSDPTDAKARAALALYADADARLYLEHGGDPDKSARVDRWLAQAWAERGDPAREVEAVLGAETFALYRAEVRRLLKVPEA